MPLGLYVHTPYCLRKCRYCDFLSYAATDAEKDAYASALTAEISLASISYSRLEFDTVYIGGGTPTTMGERLLTLIETLRSHLRIKPGAEFTVEANPDAIDRALATDLVRLGVSRLSVGVQTTNGLELAVLGRTYAFEHVAANIEALRSVQPLALNLDLMYGIPGQTIATLEKSVADALEFRPEHVSVYELTYEEGTPLLADVAAGKVDRVDEETVIQMEDLVLSRLRASGFRRYEISNFALPGFECGHNLNYWRDGEYVGLGVGAVSHLSRWRISNESSLDRYLRALAEGRLPHAAAELICTSKRILEALMLALRTADGIDLAQLPTPFVEPLLAVAQAPENRGRFVVTPARVAFTDAGMRLFNPLFLTIVDGLNL
jgi:oxygen-independent coproporphyrinogen-3 oxidase